LVIGGGLGDKETRRKGDKGTRRGETGRQGEGRNGERIEKRKWKRNRNQQKSIRSLIAE